MKRGWMVLSALVLVASGVPLVQVARDRAGAPRATLVLSHRELMPGWNHDENSGVTVNWSWATVPRVDSLTRGQLDSLGIRSEVESRLRTFPNGATAIRAMVNENAFEENTHLIGCTQVTEINNTPGAALVGVLPKEFELATVYSVGVCANAPSMAIARRFAAILTNDASLALRAKHGYEFSSI